MKQSRLIKWVDLLSFLILVWMVATGLLLEYSLPARSGLDQLWGLTRHQWGSVHFYSSMLFLALMLVHLLTHAKYIRHALAGKAPREQNYRLAAGGLGLVALVLMVVVMLFAPVEELGGGGPPHRR